MNGKLVLLCLTSVGSLEKPELRAELTAGNKLDDVDCKKAREIVSLLFNLDLDLANFYKAVKQEPTMASLTAKLRGLKSPTTQTVYEALLDSIVEQQISLKIANIMERKIVRKFGETLSVNGKAFYVYPTAEALAKAATAELRGCGLSQRKAEYINEISSRIVDGSLDLEKFKEYTDADQVVREMDAVRGIGVWTAELTVLRSMRKWDAFPADDVGLRRIISHYYRRGERISNVDARKIAEPWSPWKGLAAYYLVVAEILGVEV